MKLSFDYRWLLGFLVALVPLYYGYQQIQISWKTYEQKIDPILNVEFHIEGSKKCDLIISNDGVIPVLAVEVKLLPRLVMLENEFKVVSSIGGGRPWKTIDKMDPGNIEKISLGEKLLRTRVRNHVLFYEDKTNNPLFPVLLVCITYRRSSDNRMFTRQKYLYVAESSNKELIPFDLDKNYHQLYIDLRESLKKFDKERMGSRK